MTAQGSGGGRSFVRAIVRADRRKLAWVTAVQVLASLGQGLGLLLLVPLLGVAGVGQLESTGGLTGWWRRNLQDIGIPLTVPSVLTVYVVVVVAAALLSAYASVLLTRYRLEFVDGLRGQAYSAVSHAEWRHLIDLRRSDLITSLTVNVNWVSTGVLALLNIAVAGFLIVVQLAVAIRISPVTTAIAAGTGVFLVVVMWPLVVRSRRLGSQLVERNRQILASVTGFLDGLKLIKAHGLEAGHLDSFDESMARSRHSQIRFAKASAVSTFVQLTVTVVALALLIDISLDHLHVDIAGLLVLALIFSRLVPQVTQLQRNLMQVAQAIPAFEDLEEVIGSCAEAAEPAVVVNPSRLGIGTGVTFLDVGFSYVAGRQVLHEVSFEIPLRQTIALVGPSGAGKTTVADLVVGLLAPSSGTVLIDGRSFNERDTIAWRRAVALVPQEPFLFNESLRANLMWAAPLATAADLEDALSTAAATEFVAGLPDGLDTIVGDRGIRLSGGERQRIALARAVLRQPELLVLDEATSSLDTESELAIRTAMTALHGQLTMLVIAHRLSTVRTADRIIVLDGGRVVETGTWADLAARQRGRFRALIDAGAIDRAS